jgi:LuxR family transcriptional regulator
MEDCIASLLDNLDRSGSAEEAFEAVAVTARELGFEWCAYGHQYPLPFTRKDCVLINNYVQQWRERYDEAQYLRIDPSVQQARSSMRPMVWDDAFFRDAPQLWDEARAFGLRHGWAQASFAPNGAVGLLSLGRSNEPLGCLELRRKEPILRSLVNATHAAMSEYVGRRPPQLAGRLTSKETEMLRWTADGKSAPQVAAITALSLNTVEWHLKNAALKLGAGTRAAAVARAVAIGALR